MARSLSILLVIALVLSIGITPAFADDTHHSDTTSTPSPDTTSTPMPSSCPAGSSEMTETMDPSEMTDPNHLASMPATMETDPTMMSEMDPSMPMMVAETMSDGTTMSAGWPMPARVMPGEPMDASMPMMVGETMSDGTTMAAGEPMPARNMPPDAMQSGMHSGMSAGEMSLPIPVMRIAGPDRFGTAAAVSRSTFTSAPAVVLANGTRFPDALVSSALAGAVRGPVLLTNLDSVPTTIGAEIQRLKAKTVYLVGSSLVISSRVERTLRDSGYEVVRVAGANRYATSAAVARRVAAIRGVSSLPDALLVSGDVPWDAISASPYAYSRQMPLLLVSKTGLPADTASAIRDLRIGKLTAVGGAEPVPNAVFSAASILTPGTDVRIAGDTRYTTAHNLAHTAIAIGWATAAYPGLATGTAYPDALVGGSAAGARGGVLLLTTRDALPSSSEMLLADHAMTGEVEHVSVYGGLLAISNFVIQDVVKLVN